MNSLNENEDRLIEVNSNIIRHLITFKEHPEMTHLCLPVMFKTRNLDRERFEAAINRIIERHESLRSVFREIDGKWYQVIKKHMHITVDKLETTDVSKLIKPFDLFNGPCIRASVSEDMLFIDVHHLFMDGISYGNLFQEINHFYCGRPDPRKPVLSVEELRVPRDEIEENNRYWYKILSPEKKMVTDVPVDYENDEPIGPNSTLFYPVKLSLMDEMKQYGIRKELTPNEIATTAYILLVAQRCKDTDISFFTDMSCRSMKNIKAIGLFTNPATMRFTFDRSNTIIEFFENVKRGIKEALHHQCTEVSNIGVDRDKLTAIGFVYQRAMISEIRINDEPCIPMPIPLDEVFCHIVFSFFASKTVPWIQIEYRKDLYEYETICKFVDDYIFVLDSLVKEKFSSVKEVFAALDTKTGYADEKRGRVTEKATPLSELLSGW